MTRLLHRLTAPSVTLQHGADPNAELVAAAVAVELPPRLDPADLVGLAARAADAIGPAQVFEQFVAGVFVTELVDQLREGEPLHG